MHRRPEAELLPLDTELERTLKNMKKVRVVEGPWKIFGGLS